MYTSLAIYQQLLPAVLPAVCKKWTTISPTRKHCANVDFKNDDKLYNKKQSMLICPHTIYVWG